MNSRIPEFQSAHAILLFSNNYVLQLRDDKKAIAAAGQWSLFGGMIEKNETPLQAVIREVAEELSIKTSTYKSLWFIDYYLDYIGDIIRSWFFVSDITKLWPECRLREGRAVDIFTLDQLADIELAPLMRQVLELFHNGIEYI